MGEDLHIVYINPCPTTDKKDKQVRYKSEEYPAVTHHLNCSPSHPIADPIVPTADRIIPIADYIVRDMGRDVVWAFVGSMEKDGG